MNRTGLNEPVSNRYQRVFQGGYDNAAQHWKKALLLGLVAAVALGAWEFIAGPHGIIAKRRLEAIAASLTAENASLTDQVQTLSEQNRSLATSDFVAEKIIRESLLRARPGEVVYLFDETVTGTPLTFKDVLIVPTQAKPDPSEKPLPR